MSVGKMRMSDKTFHTLSKVPAVTLGFWIIKIFATTLGETGGDAVTMSMNLGYLIGTAIFAGIFIVAVAAQIAAKRFHTPGPGCDQECMTDAEAPDL